MMPENDKSVYGENLPPEEGKEDKGVREETAEKPNKETDTNDEFDKAREDSAERRPPSGGMGRESTPRE